MWGEFIRAIQVNLFSPGTDRIASDSFRLGIKVGLKHKACRTDQILSLLSSIFVPFLPSSGWPGRIPMAPLRNTGAFPAAPSISDLYITIRVEALDFVPHFAVPSRGPVSLKAEAGSPRRLAWFFPGRVTDRTLTLSVIGRRPPSSISRRMSTKRSREMRRRPSGKLRTGWAAIDLALGGENFGRR